MLTYLHGPQPTCQAYIQLSIARGYPYRQTHSLEEEKDEGRKVSDNVTSGSQTNGNPIY